ncbi:MAG: aldo/keto reductase [Spirochaetaceae bacterium]|nr:aldo/keto reductase [Spirochaetaceae bacterium]MDT8297179.1 aldo/keto reductase [Spirochaetaceae bacterium]
MIYRDYAGKKTAALGFGAMRFESPHDIDKSAATVLRAHEKGLTYFDTAPGYCDDQSEIIVGEAVKEMKKSRRPFTVSSKSSRSDGDRVREQLETSLKRLNVDTIDYYNCWYVLTKKDWEGRKKGGAVKAILQAKEEGLIRHAAFSTHLPGPQIREVIEEGYFEGVTLGYSVINFPFRQEGIQAAAERNMGVVVMNPLGGGLIPANPDAFGFLKAHPDQSILEAALHFLLSDPRITVSLVGFRNDEDVDSAAAAVDSFQPYTPETIETIRGKVEQEFNAMCTSCMYCNVCPEDIPVWTYMETWNHIKLSGGEDAADRLKYHWGTSIDELERCTSCGKCVRACTQRLPILERFEEVKAAVAGT